MPITALPTLDRTSATFKAAVDTFFATSLPTFVTEANATAAALNLASTTDTSATSQLIAIGAKTFTVSSGKSFQPGMYLVIADTAAASTNSMYGQVTTYSTNQLVINILSIRGSGTKAAWTISQSAAGFGTAADITNTPAGGLSATTVQDALNELDVEKANIAAVQAQTHTAATTTGTATAFAIAPVPAITAYLAGQSWWVTTHLAAGLNPTLQVSGLATPPNLVSKNGDGTFVNINGNLPAGPYRITMVSTSQAWVESLPGVQQIAPITASVAASALTATLNPVSLNFRSATLGSGAVSQRAVSSAISLVVPSTATMGAVNAVATRLVLLAIDNVGTIELAIVNLAGGNNLDETTLISTTALSITADLNNVIYSTTARSNVPFRVVGYIESTQATAGTWATAPSTIQGAGGQALAALASLGYGQTWQNVTGSRAVTTTYTNTTGKPILVLATISSTAQYNYQLSLDASQYTLGSNAAGFPTCVTFIVPHGGSYSVTASAGVGSLISWLELR